MVRRLIEEEEVGLADERAPEGDALSLSAREPLDGALVVVDAECTQDLLSTLLIVPCSLGLHLGEEALHRLAISCLYGYLPSEGELSYGIVGAEARLEYRPRLGEIGELW